MNHLIVRKDGVLCVNCLVTEPVTCGDGTPMGSMVLAFEALAQRHKDCK